MNTNHSHGFQTNNDSVLTNEYQKNHEELDSDNVNLRKYNKSETEIRLFKHMFEIGTNLISTIILGSFWPPEFKTSTDNTPK